ncbi:MAG: ChaN family lipoprotein [Rhodobacteraceae bacterium]|nr:ChaN family lipoprotein [Paracoccaceae bacterium]
MRYLIFLIAIMLSGPGAAQGVNLAEFAGADVIILGEVHDNPRHHTAQAEAVAGLRPAALVFEMLTGAQARLITGENRLDQAGLQEVLGWDETGWPDFSYYYPIFVAGNDARVFGAGLPRPAARKAFKTGVVADFGAEAGLYGLDIALDEAQHAERLGFQRAAHCNALPESLLPGMIELQRLRDAYLARAVVEALEAVGGPVVVITGNGHARKDWGMAVYLQAARPEVTVISVGLAEDGRIDGVFDKVVSFAAQARPDPCLAFQQGD